MEFLKKNIGVIVVFLIVAGIATCNFRMNKANQNALLENPELGHYYVFQDYPQKDVESIMKIKAITDSSIVFSTSTAGIIGGFEQNKSEGTIREADKNGQMFDSGSSTITKAALKDMIRNNSLSGATEDQPRVEVVFD